MQSANKSLRVPLSTKHERLDRTKGKREVLNHPQKVRERKRGSVGGIGGQRRWGLTTSSGLRPTPSTGACMRTFLSIIKNSWRAFAARLLAMVKLLSSSSLV